MSYRLVILIIAAVWLLVLTATLFWILRFFNRLTKGTKSGGLKKVLDKILETEVKNTKGINELKKEIERIQDENKLHVQKVGLVRFNPFRETGGDHSFSIALLDGRDSGFILTGLHTRERTRIYIKAISKGKSEHKLSSEEKKALTKAQKVR
jgi:hypothetical protein